MSAIGGKADIGKRLFPARQEAPKAGVRRIGPYFCRE